MDLNFFFYSDWIQIWNGFGLDRIGSDWIGLDWIGLDWIGPGRI